MLFLFLLAPNYLLAQEKEFVYKNFTQEEGLPSNETYYIFEDSKHFLWIATDNGVARYNGNRLETFDLPDKTVFQIREDTKGRIWFFTSRPQFAYYEKGKIHPYEFNKILKDRIPKLHVKDVYMDADENIYLSSSIDSNFIIKKNGDIIASGHSKPVDQPAHFQVDLSKNNKCFTKFILQPEGGGEINITVVKNNQKINYHIPEYVQNNSQYGCISPDGKTLYFFYGSVIVKLMEDGTVIVKRMSTIVLSLNYHEDLLYAGVINEGLFVFDKDLSPVEGFFFKGRSISSILFDYEEGLWLTSTDRGVFYIKNRLLKHTVTDQGNQANISYAYHLNDSTLLYANAGGFFTLTKNRNEPFIKEKNGNITQVLPLKGNSLFCFGTFSEFGSKIFYNLPCKIKSVAMYANPTRYPFIDNDNNVIYPTTMNVLKSKSAFLAQYDSYKKTHDSSLTPIKIISAKPVKIFAGKHHILWGGAQDGLYKSVPPYDTILLYNNSGLLNKGIDFITEMDNDLLVIATQPGTLVLMKDTVIGTISEKDGLLGSKIRYLLPVKDQLWVATNVGISIFKFTSLKPLVYSITNIDKKDGFYNLNINQLMQHNGDIVAATSNGLYYVEKPGSIFKQKQPVPIPFYISNISYYKGDISDVSSITLPYAKNRAIIRYRAVSFSSFESIQYRYRFTSGDTMWHNTTSNEIVLENLEPGPYNLEVKAVIPAQQRSSVVQTLSIIVEKPWWQNNWFRLFALAAVSLAVYLWVRRRIRKIKEEEKRKTDLNAKLSELEQTALRSQMNPHFIFNCLTSIQQLIISGNKTDANEYLVKFSRLIRKTLEMSARPFISIREEKEYLEEYLFLEQLRLSGKFDYTITADTSIDTDNSLIPNMMIQPVVENCVRHGIKSLENKKGVITVTFKADLKSIICTITDNGVGRSSISSFSEGAAFTKHKSYGMDIVRKRLETFSEFNIDESGIEIKDLYDTSGSPAGTEVILHLPYKNHI